MVGGEPEAPAPGIGEAALRLGIVPGQEGDGHRRFEVRQKAVDAVGPQCAVAAALAHVVDREEPVGAREQAAQTHFAGESPQRVVRDLPAGCRAPRRVELCRERGDLLFDLFDGGRG